MLPEIEALLALQVEDGEIYELEARMASLEPRLAELARDRERVLEALVRTRQTVEAEVGRQRESQDRLTQHRELQARNQATLDHLTRAKEAAAAMSQLDTSRRLMAEAEHDAQGATGRVNDLRTSLKQQEAALTEMDASQEARRAEIAAERRDLEEQLRLARMKRAGTAVRVPRPLLARYDRVRGRKRAGAVFPLRNGSCGSCDTAIPLQRRNVMQRTGEVEMCEACGVLLYATAG